MHDTMMIRASKPRIKEGYDESMARVVFQPGLAIKEGGRRL